MFACKVLAQLAPHFQTSPPHFVNLLPKQVYPLYPNIVPAALLPGDPASPLASSLPTASHLLLSTQMVIL